MDSKKDIRKAVQKQREEQTEEQLAAMSRKIEAEVFALDLYKQADTLYIYVDFNREAETKKIIEDALGRGKQVAVPKITGKEMNFYFIRSLDQLQTGYYGILEPEPVNPAPGDAGLMIMPGVAFDRQKHRIGYGGGFYDRYLSVHKQLKTAALAFSFQVFEQIPFESFDILPDILITDQEIIE